MGNCQTTNLLFLFYRLTDFQTVRPTKKRRATRGLAIVGGDKTRISTLGTLFYFGSSSTELNRTAGI